MKQEVHRGTEHHDDREDPRSREDAVGATEQHECSCEEVPEFASRNDGTLPCGPCEDRGGGICVQIR